MKKSSFESKNWKILKSLAKDLDNCIDPKKIEQVDKLLAEHGLTREWAQQQMSNFRNTYSKYFK